MKHWEDNSSCWISIHSEWDESWLWLTHCAVIRARTTWAMCLERKKTHFSWLPWWMVCSTSRGSGRIKISASLSTQCPRDPHTSRLGPMSSKRERRVFLSPSSRLIFTWHAGAGKIVQSMFCQKQTTQLAMTNISLNNDQNWLRTWYNSLKM